MTKSILLRSTILLAFALVLPLKTGAAPLGTAINYQGYLAEKNKPATGLYDFTFKLYDSSTAGSLVGSPNTVSLNAVAVSNGWFSAALDFGSTAFQGDARWVEIAVAPNGSFSFTVQNPRVELRPTPNALYAVAADSAATAGTATTALTANGITANGVTTAGLQNNSVTAAKIATGQVVKSVNGLFDDVTLAVGAGLSLSSNGNTLTFDALGAGNNWLLSGNPAGPGQFLGTTGNQPLELRANGKRGLELEYANNWNLGSVVWQSGVNVLGGFWENQIFDHVVGATIAGGGGQQGSSILGGDGTHPNYVEGNYGTVGGGLDNMAGEAASVPGGQGNYAKGWLSFAAGRNANALHDGCFVWNDATAFAPHRGGVGFDSLGDWVYDNPTTAPNQFRIKASGGVYISEGSEGVNLDQLNQNDGDVRHTLRFGTGSGEAIGSKRTTGGNQWGLDFYTAYAKRMSIANNGSVGIGTDQPQQQLHVYGAYALVEGAGNEQAYIGGDGWGGDVQIGSLNAGVQNVALYNAASGQYMHLAVKSLSILGGADLAEPFPMTDEEVAPGTVVVIDPKHAGHLKACTSAYDTKVAGVVSGAGGIQPGVSLIQADKLEAGRNVALTGRVYVQVDASHGAIEPGDLLTTSDTPGHAMKVTDSARAQGTILGKAMTSLADGRGLVLALVTLQ